MVHVYGGVVYSDPSNDYFVASHGIRTPDYFWKSVVTANAAGETQAISWYIPNQADLGNLDAYIRSINELEAEVGAENVNIPVKSRRSRGLSRVGVISAESSRDIGQLPRCSFLADRCF